VLTIKIKEETLKEIENKYSDFITARNIGYILFVIEKDEYILTVYDNKKRNFFKMTIQGPDPMKIANMYNMEENIIPKKKKIVKESPHFIDVDMQIGSDEVGVGDFLGPIVVCAAFVNHETMGFIEKYNIVDSKKLSDAQIKEIIPLIKNKIYYEYIILNNDRYNNAISKGFNLNYIKAILHNRCLYNLHQKFPYVKNLYVDQFCEPNQYFAYLYNCKKIEKKIVFKTKGESYFPSVALASCIARFHFLEYMDTLSDNLKIKVPFGAGIEVDNFAKEYIDKYGIESLKNICKTNFKNYKDLLTLKN